MNSKYSTTLCLFCGTYIAKAPESGEWSPMEKEQ